MGLPELDNLLRVGQLKAEPRNVPEVTRMIAMAQTRLGDARLDNLSLEGRFTSAYNAAHAAALAALLTAGGCWIPRTRSATWPSTKVILRSKRPR